MKIKVFNESVELYQNPNWLFYLDHSYKILIISDSGSGKTKNSKILKTRY